MHCVMSKAYVELRDRQRQEQESGQQYLQYQYLLQLYQHIMKTTGKMPYGNYQEESVMDNDEG